MDPWVLGRLVKQRLGRSLLCAAAVGSNLTDRRCFSEDWPPRKKNPVIGLVQCYKSIMWPGLAWWNGWLSQAFA
jgi:hypothetical protein